MYIDLKEKVKLENLKTKFLGKDCIYYKSIDSTQAEIFRNIEEKNITNGKVVLADLQYSGQRNTWKKMVYRRVK